MKRRGECLTRQSRQLTGWVQGSVLTPIMPEVVHVPKGHIATLNGAPPLLLCHKVQQFQLSTCICNQHSPGVFVPACFVSSRSQMRSNSWTPYPFGVLELGWVLWPHRVSFVCDSPSQKHLHGCEPWGYDIPTADAWLASSCCFKQHISNFLSNMLNQEMKTTTCDLRSTGRDPSIQPTSLEISWCSTVLRLPHCHPPSHCEVCRTEHLTEYVVLNVEAVQKSEAAWHAEKRAACTEYTFECCCFVGSGKAESAT